MFIAHKHFFREKALSNISSFSCSRGKVLFLIYQLMPRSPRIEQGTPMTWKYPILRTIRYQINKVFFNIQWDAKLCPRRASEGSRPPLTLWHCLSPLIREASTGRDVNQRRLHRDTGQENNLIVVFWEFHALDKLREWENKKKLIWQTPLLNAGAKLQTDHANTKKNEILPDAPWFPWYTFFKWNSGISATTLTYTP